MKLCGHTAYGNGFTYVCDLPEGHKGLHAQRIQLRRSTGNETYTSITNWGSDGLAPHATKDRAWKGR